MFNNYILFKYLILLGNDYYKTSVKFSLKELKVVIVLKLVKFYLYKTCNNLEMSFCIRTDEIIGMRMSEKCNSYTIALTKLVWKKINNHIHGLGFFFIIQKTFCVLLAQTSNKTRTFLLV